MSKKRKEEKKSAELKLPASGLAEDILEYLKEETPADEPTEQESTAADRIYSFADSLQSAEEDAAEKETKREKWVTFVLQGESFGLPVTHVREVLRVGAITRVPHAPLPVRGITNVRGRVMPVVDLRRRIGLQEVEVTPQTRVLVAEVRGRIIGLLVDAVHNVLSLDPSRIEPPPSDVMTVKSDYILGVYNQENHLLILLDAEKVFLIQGELE